MKIDRNTVRAAADKAGIFDHDCISTIDKLMNFLLFYNYQPTVDPETWRERNRRRQAAGVKFEWFNEGIWRQGYKGSIFTFDIGGEEDYREVPQEVFGTEYARAALEHLTKTYSADKGTAQLSSQPTPHAAERALWKAQREAGTNEQWQGKGVKLVTDWFDLDFICEPAWHPDFIYRPKPKPAKLTAKIVREDRWGTVRQQDWEFYGTPEGYRVECEKYGYAVVSEIKEVVEKPKTVKRYMAMLKYKTDPPFSCVMDSCHTITLYATRKGYNIIGNIEEREVPIE